MKEKIVRVKIESMKLRFIQFFQKTKLKLNNSTKQIFPLGFHYLKILYLTIIVLKPMTCEVRCCYSR